MNEFQSEPEAASREVWLKTPHGLVGPLSPEQLREHVREGRVGPDAQASHDREVWFPLRRVSTEILDSFRIELPLNGR